MEKDRRIRIQKAFGLAIRELREGQGLSQRALAEKGEFQKTYIGKIERGEVAVRWGTFCRLADALGTSLSEITERVYNHLKPSD